MCPICNLHVREFLETMRKSRKQAFRSDHLPIKTGAAGGAKWEQPLQSGNIHLVADPTRQLYQAFGVHKSLLSVAHPGAWWSTMKGVASLACICRAVWNRCFACQQISGES